jgi:Flp pilus assembly protein TadG
MRLLKKILGDTRGAAAVEFGLVLPVLAGIVILLPDVSEAGVGAMNMDSAMRAGVQYAMNGGTNVTSVQSFANSNWPSKPHGATLTASAACYCDDTVITCGNPCTGTQVAKTYITVAATATVGGAVISVPLSKSERVRVQ